MCEGNCSIVNGYKEPLLKRAEVTGSADDSYKIGTSFDDNFALFAFDRSFRVPDFRNFIKAEGTLRTAIAYTFAFAYRAQDAYLLQESYCTESECLKCDRGWQLACR